jgi:putative PIN family toxin of toxin-antitoxin system
LKVVLDTNVYISAILFGGNCEEILRLSSSGLFDIIISKAILKEVKDILHTKFKWSGIQISETISYIKEITTEIEPHLSVSIIKNDPSDNRILECAITAKADYIVTGDKNHLLPLKRYKNIRILSPSEFLRL